MARRSHLHLTEVCALASGCDDLSILGLGEREGWLDDPSLLSSLSPYNHSLALAHPSKSLILVLASTSGDRVGNGDYAVVSRIRPSLGESDGLLAAIEWVPHVRDGEIFEGDDAAPVLAVGTTLGYLLFYSLAGELIHKQSIYPGRILRLKFRTAKAKAGSLQESVSDELSIVFSGIIARFDGLDIQDMLQKWSDEAGSRVWNKRFQDGNEEEESNFSTVPFQLWNVNKFGSCADAAIVGLMPPPLMEIQSSRRYYCAVTIGEDSVISAYRLSEDRSRSLVGAILSRVGTATISTISSFSSIFWRREPSPTKKLGPNPNPSQKTASPLTCVKDPPRRGERLTLSPSGTLAAVTDSLGRILLLDTQALVVVRLWKGYRDAHCLFVEMLAKKEKSATSSNYYGYSKNDYCLCLAIHAPRKGIIEVWQMRTGPRLLTIQCPKGSKMLQPSIRLSSNSSYNPLEVYLLNGDSGQLFALNRHIS